MSASDFRKVDAKVDLPALDAEVLALWDRIDAFKTQPVERVMERIGEKLEGVTIDIQPWASDATPQRVQLEGN